MPYFYIYAYIYIYVRKYYIFCELTWDITCMDFDTIFALFFAIGLYIKIVLFFIIIKRWELDCFHLVLCKRNVYDTHNMES